MLIVPMNGHIKQLRARSFYYDLVNAVVKEYHIMNMGNIIIDLLFRHTTNLTIPMGFSILINPMVDIVYFHISSLDCIPHPRLILCETRY
jgi:hypothetical protein